jgi:tetratricopeptide (TPR) repeat protein
VGNPLIRVGRGVLLATIIATLIPVVGFAAERHRLAYSKKLAVEIFAEGTNSDWCRETLHLRMVAANETLFQKSAFQTLMRKLGTVIQQECPKAEVAEVLGFSAGTEQQVFENTAIRAKNWTFQSRALVATPPVPRIPGGDSLKSRPREKISREETIAWARARAAKTMTGYESYLSEWPKGKWQAGARTAIRELLEKVRRGEQLRQRELLKQRRYNLSMAVLALMALSTLIFSGVAFNLRRKHKKRMAMLRGALGLSDAIRQSQWEETDQAPIPPAHSPKSSDDLQSTEDDESASNTFETVPDHDVTKAGEATEDVAQEHEINKSAERIADTAPRRAAALLRSNSAPAIRSEGRDQVDETEDTDCTLVDKGWRLFMDGKDKDALTVATEALREFPNDPKAWALSAETKAATGLLKDAEYEYKKAVNLEPSNALFRAGLGSIYERIGDVEQALEQYRVAVEFEPSETEYRAALYGAMRKTERLDESIMGLKQCVAEEPNYERYGTMLGEAYMAAAYNCLTFVPPGNDVPEGYYATTKNQITRAESCVRKAKALNSSDEGLQKEIQEFEKTIVFNKKRFFALTWWQWVIPLIYIVGGVIILKEQLFAFLLLSGSGIFYIFAMRPPQYILNRAIIRGLDEGIGDKALNLLGKVMNSNIFKETDAGMVMGAALGSFLFAMLPFIAVYRFYQNYLKD